MQTTAPPRSTAPSTTAPPRSTAPSSTAPSSTAPSTTAPLYCAASRTIRRGVKSDDPNCVCPNLSFKHSKCHMEQDSDKLIMHYWCASTEQKVSSNNSCELTPSLSTPSTRSSRSFT